MEENIISAAWPTRRDFIATAAAVSAASLLPGRFSVAGDGSSFRPFRVAVPEKALVDLRRRIAATRWADRETVDDHFIHIRSLRQAT